MMARPAPPPPELPLVSRSLSQATEDASQHSSCSRALVPLDGAPPAYGGGKALSEWQRAKQWALVGGAAAAQGVARPELLGTRCQGCHVSFTLGTPVDLEVIARRIPNSEIRRSDAHVYVRRLREPRWTATVSASGKVMMICHCDGEFARTAAKQFARAVQKRCYSVVTFKDYRQLNVMVLSHVGFSVDLEALIEHVAEAQGCGGVADDAAGGARAKFIDRNALSASFAVIDCGGVAVRVFGTGQLRVEKSWSIAEAVAAMQSLLPVVALHGQWW